MRPLSDWSMIARARRVAATMSRVRMRCLMRGMLRGAIDSELSQKSVSAFRLQPLRLALRGPAAMSAGRISAFRFQPLPVALWVAPPRCRPAGWIAQDSGRTGRGKLPRRDDGKEAECAALSRPTFAGPDTPFQLNPASRVLLQLSPSGATCSAGR